MTNEPPEPPRFTWSHSDPEPEEWRIVYRRVGASDWHILGEGETLPVGEYEWKHELGKRSGLWSPWSGLTVAPKPPTITGPPGGRFVPPPSLLRRLWWRIVDTVRR